jgi:hypothetical protein
LASALAGNFSWIVNNVYSLFTNVERETPIDFMIKVSGDDAKHELANNIYTFAQLHNELQPLNFVASNSRSLVAAAARGVQAAVVSAAANG